MTPFTFQPIFLETVIYPFKFSASLMELSTPLLIGLAVDPEEFADQLQLQVKIITISRKILSFKFHLI